MAVKSIIDVEINDGAFQKFQANWQRYQAQLAKNPGLWAAANAAAKNTAAAATGASNATAGMGKSAAGIGQSFQKMNATLMANQRLMASIVVGQKSNVLTARSQEDSWKMMAKHAKEFAGNIWSATRSLLRWGTLTGVISGLLGVGGLFGIERLAMSAASQRKSAAGMNLPTGDVSAFNTNYRRLLQNPEGMLQNVARAQSDPAHAGDIRSLGLSEKQLQGNAADVSVRLIEAMKRLADRTDENKMGGVFDAFRLGTLGLTPEDFRALKGRPGSEIADYGRDFEKDRKAMNLPPAVLKAWDDLNTVLSRAGTKIEAILINKLADLAEPLSKLSTSVVELFSAMLKSPKIKEWINDLAGGLDHFARHIGTDEFRKRVTDFVEDIGKMATAIGHFVSRIARFFPGEADKEQYGPPAPPSAATTAADAAKAAQDAEWDQKARNRVWPTPPAGDADAQRKKRGDEQYTTGFFTPRANEFFRNFWNTMLDALKKRPGEDSPFIPGGYNPSGGRNPPSGGGMPGIIPAAFRPNIAPGGAGGITGRFAGNAKITHDFFKQQNWSEVAIAGLMANIDAESGFDPQRVNPVGGDAGLMQWRGKDRAGLFERMFGHKVQEGTLMEQLRFAQYELTQGSEKAHGDILRRMVDPYRAGSYVTTDIERPDPKRVGTIAAQRAAAAVRIYIENNTGGNAVVRAASAAVGA